MVSELAAGRHVGEQFNLMLRPWCGHKTYPQTPKGVICTTCVLHTYVFRVLSRIFGLGGKMLKVTVDGGCSDRLQFFEF